MTRQQEVGAGQHRVQVHFVDDHVVEAWTTGPDLSRPDVHLSFSPGVEDHDSAIVPLSSIKRVLVRREALREPAAADVLRKVALHFWDGEVLKGLLRSVPVRHQHGMTLELVSPSGDCAEVLALPYHPLKAIFFLRSWDTRAPQLAEATPRACNASRQEAALVNLLGEIRGLRGLRRRGQISEVEYERRRTQVLDRI